MPPDELRYLMESKTRGAQWPSQPSRQWSPPLPAAETPRRTSTGSQLLAGGFALLATTLVLAALSVASDVALVAVGLLVMVAFGLIIGGAAIMLYERVDLAPEHRQAVRRGFLGVLMGSAGVLVLRLSAAFLAVKFSGSVLLLVIALAFGELFVFIVLAFGAAALFRWILAHRGRALLGAAPIAMIMMQVAVVMGQLMLFATALGGNAGRDWATQAAWLGALNAVPLALFAYVSFLGSREVIGIVNARRLELAATGFS